MVYMWTVGRCIVCTGVRLLLLIHLFISSFFFLSNFQTLKIFVTLYSRTVRPRRCGQYADVSCIPESGCCCLFIPLFLHFSFSPIFKQIFVTLFSRTVRPRRITLGTHVDNGWMYCVYRNQAAAANCLFISSFFFLSNFQTLQFFVTYL